MAIYGKIDCLIPTGGPNSSYWVNGCFKALWDFLKYLETQGVCTEIGRFNGVYPSSQALTGMTSAGTGYPGDTNPFGMAAWYTFRMNATETRSYPYYLHFHYLTFSGTNFPANHGGAYQNDSTAPNWGNVGVQIARGIGGTENPWNGTGALGSSIKGINPYWVTPPGGTDVAVLPRSNGIGGGYAATKINMSGLFGADTNASCRLHMISDGDGIVILHTIGSGNYHFTYLGPTFGLPFSDPPLVMFAPGTSSAVNLPLNISSTYGGITGNEAPNGGAVTPLSSQRTIRMDRFPTIASTAPYAPNKQFSPNRYDEFPVPVYSNEAGHEGLLGFLPTSLIYETYGIASHDTNTSLTRAFFNNGTTNAASISIPWDGTTVPNTTASKDGVTFTI
jgi:hypothetical protein